ncbi:MAG: Gfo/Idh/MocA family protein [Anaerolineae bacterium]
MDRIKIGQIGIGHFHAEGKMATARKYPEVFEIVGIAESDPANMAKYADHPTYRGLTWMSQEELIAYPGIQAVLVETNEWDLVPTAQRCVSAGLHVHLDKPAGEDIRAYAALLSEAKRKHLAVQLGYMYRYNPAVQYCYQAVKGGMLGDVYAVDTVMNTEHTREVREYLGRFYGGTMYIFGCHLLDLVISLQGMPENIVPYQKKTGLDGVDVYDSGLAVCEYPRGTSTVRTTSVEVKGFSRRQLVISGSRGTVEVKPLEDPPILTLVLANHTREHVEYSHDGDVRLQAVALPEAAGRYDEQLLDFAAMVRGEKENPFSYEHELRVQAATLKASGFDIDLQQQPTL